MTHRSIRRAAAVLEFCVFAVLPVVFPVAAAAQTPDHPVITEVFTDPIGASDGPVGRDPANLDQEYIEIYLPPASLLTPALNKDALRLTFYEVEGDSSSSGNALVNYRIDLPTFDLDATNGITFGAIQRPSSGVVVIGWVDYVGNPPFDLAGTPATRVALINGGITTATAFTFVAMNGAQFSGTTNFPVPVAVSSIDLPNEASSGIIQNGSGAYLLVNRDAFGYVELFDDKHIPPGGSADPSLPTGTVLGVDALLDGFASNDDSLFDVLAQPYASPTGQNIDLETVLPLGGAFSLLVAQVAEAGENGYARLFVDVVKTTEDGILFNEDPVADALSAYRTISNVGPLFPTPGRVPFTNSPPELAVADASLQVINLLAGTSGGFAIVGANAGGNFGMQVAATPNGSSDPAAVAFGPGAVDTVLTGQTPVFPEIDATVLVAATDGALVTTGVTVTASNAQVGDPPVVNPTGSTTATVGVINPSTGLDAAGLPFQATAFVAMQGLPRQPGVLNEFLGTSLSQFVADNLGGLVDDERNNGLLLLDPFTDLSNPFLVDAMEQDMPVVPQFFINAPSPAGLDDLVTTIITSAEVLVGNGTYDNNFDVPPPFNINIPTVVRAIEMNIAETRTSGGVYTPTETVHFVAAGGAVGLPTSGLTGVTTTRGFELALLDSNVQQFGTLETGETDDFGLIVEVGQTRPGAQVVPGEFVFLSYTGGLEGADINSVNVPPHNNETVIIYVDLDPLDSVLGCETITRLFVIDGSGGGVLNVIEAFSLNAVTVPVPGVCTCKGDVNLDGVVDGQDVGPFIGQILSPGDPAVLPEACAADLSGDGLIGTADVASMIDALLTGACGPAGPLICTCKGDVNLDGIVDGADIQPFIVQVMNPGDPAVLPEACAADVNDDGLIDGADAASMAQSVLTGTCGAPPPPLCNCKGDVNLDGQVNGQDIAPFIDQVLLPGDPGVSPAACAADLSLDNGLGPEDIPLMVSVLISGACG